MASRGEQPPSGELEQRLLEAWRREVEAAAVYELIAARMDASQADILRRMAAAEGGHRRRLEARMSGLGIPVPDPSKVGRSRWLRTSDLTRTPSRRCQGASQLTIL